MDKSFCVLLFVKFPEPGKVKTRLGKDIGLDAACQLYALFVQDALTRLDALELPTIICYAPASKTEPMHQWLGQQRSYLPQKGHDLGVRMEQSFIDAFAKGYASAALIGSDTPDLPLDVLHLAQQALRTHDVVLGPAEDGGYYCLGMTHAGFTHAPFHNIAWSQPDVLEKTLQALQKKQRSVHTLRTWSDVDTLPDLKNLYERNKSTDFARSATYAYVRTLFSTQQS